MKNLLKAAKKLREIADLAEYKHECYDQVIADLEEAQKENKRMRGALLAIAGCDACGACQEIAKVALGEV